jgi:hypothetical protein
MDLRPVGGGPGGPAWSQGHLVRWRASPTGASASSFASSPYKRLAAAGRVRYQATLGYGRQRGMPTGPVVSRRLGLLRGLSGEPPRRHSPSRRDPWPRRRLASTTNQRWLSRNTASGCHGCGWRRGAWHDYHGATYSCAPALRPLLRRRRSCPRITAARNLIQSFAFGAPGVGGVHRHGRARGERPSASSC